MDSISVKLLERKFYKNKLESSKIHFEILITEIESLTFQLDYEKKKNKNLNSIISQKDIQINTLQEQRTLDELTKPSFINQVGRYGIFALVGFVLGVILTL